MLTIASDENISKTEIEALVPKDYQCEMEMVYVKSNGHEIWWRHVTPKGQTRDPNTLWS